VDIWTGYELSWLNAKGKPQVAVAEFQVPANSPNIIESKSFKLYLNSFNQTCFSGLSDIVTTLESDLSMAAGAPVMVSVQALSQAVHRGVGHFVGDSIDDLDVDIDCYRPNADLLRVQSPEILVRESLSSDLLKSNCPVTGQPDWASVYISYHGPKIDRESLLKYVVSFREHQDFHEHCVERMFVDINKHCKPLSLSVYARYTRRGGLDINPFRTNADGDLPLDVRLVRQ
jgi:7-cyano-7-deazaguanine reductase